MTIPQALQEIADDFGAMEESQRLELLLEFSDELPDLPQRLKDDPKLLEPVPECQSPIFIRVEVDGTQPDSTVHLFFSAPPEAPTTRGFAGILNEGLNGSTVQTVLDVPADFPLKLNIEKQVSPLRLNGMSGMLARIQRQVREKADQ
ncbi:MULTISPECIES: SufE family protein [unclassified Brevibacterium]|uniref:SufE family protein n=1 Tax=unclassified Brevibacterium TaxID=2614124 RepID=UPI0008A6106F|nr:MULTISPECIES: SufE family protein [unclassified Brevibacterium]OFL65269.1 cysteine desufuration protein SufE [Brevibacterium sp. HMSC063G07]